MTTTTPNMDLVLPDVSSTVGPTWASLLNAALEAVDSHDHSTDSGVAVTPAGLNINANLTMGDFSLTNLGSADLTNQASTLASGSRRIFAYGSELYYRDGSGNNVQITSGGSVAGAAAGAISNLVAPASADYSAVNGKFTWLVDTGEAAKMAISDVVLYAFGEVSPNPVTIKSPAALASAYSITLPDAVPAATYPITMTSAGVLGNSGTIGLAAGSASAPSLGFAADTNTGFYNIGADQLGMSIGGTLRATFSTTASTLTLPIYGPAGAAATPTYTFSTDTNTGWYSTSADIMSASTGGTQRLQLSTTAITSTIPILAPVGSVSAAGFAFDGDADTGMYRSGANDLSWTTGGGLRATLNSLGLVTTVPILATAGTVSAPGYCFTGDNATGFYYPGASQIGLSIAGSNTMAFSSSYVALVVPLWVADGTAANPGLGFDSDFNTGFNWNSSGSFSAITNGTATATFSTSALTTTLPVRAAAGSVSAPSYSFSSDTNSGMYNSGSNSLKFSADGTEIVEMDASGVNVEGTLAFTGGSGFKVYVGTGSLASGADAVVFNSGSTGVSSVTTIYSVSGYTETSGSGSVDWCSMGSTNAQSGGCDFFITAASTPTQVAIKNYGSGTNSYRVVIVYS